MFERVKFEIEKDEEVEALDGFCGVKEGKKLGDKTLVSKLKGFSGFRAEARVLKKFYILNFKLLKNSIVFIKKEPH